MLPWTTLRRNTNLAPILQACDWKIARTDQVDYNMLLMQEWAMSSIGTDTIEQSIDPRRLQSTSWLGCAITWLSKRSPAPTTKTGMKATVSARKGASA